MKILERAGVTLKFFDSERVFEFRKPKEAGTYSLLPHPLLFCEKGEFAGNLQPLEPVFTRGFVDLTKALKFLSNPQ